MKHVDIKHVVVFVALVVGSPADAATYDYTAAWLEVQLCDADPDSAPTRAPADPYFSTNVRVAPGHFIDRDNVMDRQKMGGAEVCDPPNGTVHYFDPDQNLPRTRTGDLLESLSRR